MPQTPHSQPSPYHFLNGTGEMGELIRQKDWSETAVGAIETWPQSLVITLSNLLRSKFPKFLWWGNELTCFYNDAYRPSLGNNGKHPHILGQNAKDAWAEIWDIIFPLITQVLQTGEATWSENQLIPIFRNGKIEDVYWTFSYSAVTDETGKIAGVLVTCSETTKEVEVLRKIKEKEQQLNLTIDAAEIALWDFDSATRKFKGNERLYHWFGKSSNEIFDLGFLLDKIIERDRNSVKQKIEHILSSKKEEPFELEFSILDKNSHKERRILAQGKSFFYDSNYKISGILQDISQRNYAKETLEKSEKLFRNTVKHAPLGITILSGEDFMVEMANETYLQIVDKKENEFVGKPLFEVLPEVKDAVDPILKKVYHSGVPYNGIEFPVQLNRFGITETTYFNFVYYPLKDDEGEITGIIVVASEVTSSVKAKHALTESEKQFRNLVMQSPIPMCIFMGEDNIITLANNAMFNNIWRKTPKEVLGKKLMDVFPELKDQKYPQLLSEVYRTGIPHSEKESLATVEGNDGIKNFYLDFEYMPLFDIENKISGIIITVNDVSEKVEARKKVENTERRLRLATDAMNLATWDLNINTSEIIHSYRLAEIFGHDPSKVMTHQEMRAQVNSDDKVSVVEKAFEEAMKTGRYEYEARITRPDGKMRWISTQGKLYYDEDKKPYKLIGTLRDITKEKLHQQSLKESEEKFRLLADSMPQHIWTADTEGNLNYFNRSVFDFSGLSPEQIEKDGWLQIVHPDDRQKNIEKWTEAIKSGDDFLFEHRFRRYDGVYRWQLSRAIPQRDAEGHIQMWVGTSTDIEDQKTFVNELAKQVKERTLELEMKNKDLEKMNMELQSFAYVSSHDLQEPLRKIQTFASRILEKESHNLSDVGKDYFNRLHLAANRMQTLIEDLLAYSRTNSTEYVLLKTDLNEIVSDIKYEMRELIYEKNATLEIGNLCKIDIIPFQFRQLMTNLISNSLKFSAKGKKPFIKIVSKPVNANEIDSDNDLPYSVYCHISVSDNGIGFDEKYKEKIFEVFQRLHNKEAYTGTGIGLAIVKKIVENHNGFINVSSKINEGTTFHIYLPAAR